MSALAGFVLGCACTLIVVGTGALFAAATEVEVVTLEDPDLVRGETEIDAWLPKP